jgi:UPF0755 protein
MVLFVASVGVVFLAKTKEFAFSTQFYFSDTGKPEALQHIPAPFPIGVNPAQKLITENPNVDSYLNTQLSSNTHSKKNRWLEHVTAKLALFEWYQNLASPIGRILVIQSGERREEIAGNFGSILHWNTDEENAFTTLVGNSTPELEEGKFYPGNYVVDKDATPEHVATLLTQRFQSEVVDRYPEEISVIVPLHDSLTIASLLEREAYDFEDMRQIAGVIWNRLFVGMNLQIDASLQYAKGSGPTGPWWPVVQPKDKYIESPYNTYKNKGLPPLPIGNSSIDAIVAALNPKNTECMFYFHDSHGNFHCTKTYEEHVVLLKKYYGQGK